MVKASEKRKNRVASAGRRLKEHKSGSRPSLNVPHGVKYFAPKRDDTYTLDIMPFKVTKTVKRFKPDLIHCDPGDLYYEQTFWTHRDIGPDSQSVVCPRATFDKKCPVCDERSRMSQDPKFKDTVEGKKTIKDLAPKERQLFLVYDHDDKRAGVQLWEISFHNFGVNLDEKIKKSPEEVREAREAFHDPDAGFTLRLTAREKSMGPGTKPFLEFFVDDFLPRKKPLDPKLLASCPNLCEVPVLLEYEELKKMFLQTTGDAEEDADEEKPKNKKRAKDEDDEIEDSEEDAEEDEDSDDDETEETEDDDDDSDSEDSDDEDDSEIEVGSKVTGVYKKKTRVGVVKKIKGTLALVAVKGMDKLWSVELDEIALFEEEGEDEDEETEETDDESELDEDSDESDDEDEEPLEDDDEDSDDEEEEKPNKKGVKKPPAKKKRR